MSSPKPDASMHSALLRSQLEQLYRSTTTGMSASLAMSLFLGLTLLPDQPHSDILSWFGAQALVTLFGLLAHFAFRYYRTLFSDNRWEYFHLSLTACTTLLWSLAIIKFFPFANTIHQALIIFLISGLHMGAAITLSFRPAPVLVFVGTTSILLLKQLIEHPEWLSSIAIGLYLVFIPIVAFTSVRQYRSHQQEFLHQQRAARNAELLKRSEQRLRSIINSAGDILLVHNHSGRIIDANQRAVELLKYDNKDELLGKDISAIAGESSDIYHNLLRIIGHNEPLFYESHYHCADNSTIPVDACISHYDDPTEGESILVLARDLTVKQQEKEELNESRQKLDLHVQATPLAVIEWDKDFKIKSWNPAAERIFGFHADEIIGQNGLDLLLSSAFQRKSRDIFQSLIANQAYNHSTIQNITKDGRTIYCEWFNTPLVAPSGKVLGIASLALNVTERIHAEQALQTAIRREQAANSAKSDFLSRVSHELRTPLNAVIGLSDLLHTDENLTKDQVEYIHDIQHAGQHLLRLVNDILDLSRIEQGKITLNEQPESFHNLINSAISLSENLIKQNQLTLNYQATLNDFFLLIDKQRVVQVLINLISNAAKYNHPGGYIKISEERMKDGFFKITVEDNGDGIAIEYQNKIFEAFQRCGAEFSGIEGSGLGLMLSKQLIEKMGGTIGFESTHEKGSKFWITLPSKATALLNYQENTNNTSGDSINS